jgi:3-isopropylmalate dehydrogenase
MLLRYGLKQAEAATVVEQAVAGVLKAGLRTADLARPGEPAVGSRAMGEEIARRIEIGRMAVPARV